MPRITEITSAIAPIASAISNAYIDFSKMTASVVAVHTDVLRDGRPVIGYGFNSNGRYAARGILADRLIPRVLEALPENLCTEAGDNLDPVRIWDVAMRNEKPGGHGERSVAMGVLDMALWDAAAKIAGVPLYQLVADRYGDGQCQSRVFVYAAGGYYYPGKDLQHLKAEMQSYLDRGYSVVKMKIGGDSLDADRRRIEAALEVVGAGERLAVDANGRFDLDTALRYAEALAPYGLFWFEEPGDPLDFVLHAELGRHYDGALATGENLFSHQDGRNLLRYGGMRPDRDTLQLDCALSYGLVEYQRFLTLLPDFGFSGRNCIPHGGHQMSLNIAAGLGLGGNESYPDVFHPFGGFADGTPVEDGYVGLHDCPGVGFEQKAALIECLRDVTGT
ncbi:MAG: mandelate racemase/muconate lactonizing enzyme family protein [Pseudomonadota bacterium]